MSVEAGKIVAKRNHVQNVETVGMMILRVILNCSPSTKKKDTEFQKLKQERFQMIYCRKFPCL